MANASYQEDLSQLNLALPQSLKRDVRLAAARQEISMSQLVKTYIEDGLRRSGQLTAREQVPA